MLLRLKLKTGDLPVLESEETRFERFVIFWCVGAVTVFILNSVGGPGFIHYRERELLLNREGCMGGGAGVAAPRATLEPVFRVRLHSELKWSVQPPIEYDCGPFEFQLQRPSFVLTVCVVPTEHPPWRCLYSYETPRGAVLHSV